jgi:glycosyltransferase involved in cell wall biosynthesis
MGAVDGARLVYLSETWFPSRRTNSIQTMHMCAGFAAAGADVTLVHPRHDGEPPEGFAGDVLGFYGVPGSFEQHRLEHVTTQRVARLGRAGIAPRAVSVGACLTALARDRQRDTIVYSRSHLVVRLALELRRALGPRCRIRAVVGEVHDAPPSESAARALARADGVVVISRALGDWLVERWPQLEDRIWVEHDGADVDALKRRQMDVAAAREALGMATAGPVVTYTGRVNAAKGAEVLLAAAGELGDVSARVVLVGKVYDESYLSHPGATFTGFVAPSEVPLHLAAADILVMPSTEDLQYAAFTSPLKLFEYMASGRPLVASGLGSVREVLEHERNALLFPPGDAAALAAAIRRLHGDPALARRLADQAQIDVEQYSWVRRAERILERLRALPRD